MKIFFFLGICLIAFPLSFTQGQPFLKTRDQQIIDGSGNEIILRGMGLGGWMLQEGYMLQIRNSGTQHSIKKRITDLIGQEDCEKFYNLWLQNHVTRADIDSLAKWGFNSVRLPMHYNLFTLPIESEPVQGQNTWLTKGFQLTDSLLSWCKANNIYLILDLHAAPGGQGKDANISDYDESKPSLWESELNKQKTVALWKKLAERYANESWIGGYDLINEPNWTFEGKNKNGLEDSQNKAIWDLYIQITQAIREVDKNHIIIIEGNGWGNNYNGFPRTWDNNLVFSFHKYWSPNRQDVIQWIVDLRDRYNIPVWLGESGENSNKWFTECISLMETNHIGWCWWPLKKINSVVCPLMVVAPMEYKMITEYWNENGEKPSVELAKNVLFNIAENLKASKCRFNKDITDAMFRQRNQHEVIPFNQHEVPGRIYATDFDLGQAGMAYVDKDSENTGEEGKKAGNKGYLYRNDGPDIGICSDERGFTNGYLLNSVEDGEWLQYTLTVKEKRAYKINLRTFNQSSPGRVRLYWYKSIPLTNESEPETALESIVIPVTNQNETWNTLTAGTIKLSQGKYFLRLIVEKGGFELNFLDIE